MTPTRVLAGVTVPDTPLLAKVIEYTRAHNSPWAFNHVMRSWLFGFQMAAAGGEGGVPFHERDAELHAIAAIMHDLGWDCTGELISSDKRFEVDSANAARAFILREAAGADWAPARVQLLWDAIALHTLPSIALHKQPEVVATCHGVLADFAPPGAAFPGALSADAHRLIMQEFPRENFVDGLIEQFCGFCRDKPDTTYDNFVGDFGEMFVEGYSRDGKRGTDVILEAGRQLDRMYA